MAPEAATQAVGGGCQSGWGGYCRLQMPSRLALGVGETVAGHRLGALKEGGVGVPPPPFQCIPGRACLTAFIAYCPRCQC